MSSDEELQSDLDETLAEFKHLAISDEDEIEFHNTYSVAGGSYGDISKATMAGENVVAVKQLRMTRRNPTTRRLAMDLARELRVWAKLKHPHILELIGYHLNIETTRAWLISPFMAKGTIAKYLDTTLPPVVNSVRIKLVKGVLRGLVYLHSRNPPICHGDIKPDNVLITDDVEAILCDFGLAHEIDDHSNRNNRYPGGARYTCPERLFEENAGTTLASDIWAYGCLVLRVMTGFDPYSEFTTERSVILAMCDKHPPAKILQFQDEDLEELVRRCWNVEPSLRPTAAQCLQE